LSTGGAANVLLELIFCQKWRGAIFWSFFPSLIAHGTKIRRVIALVFGTLGYCLTMHSNWKGRIFGGNKIELAKNPENLIKFYSIEVGQIEHFICYPNGYYCSCTNPL